MRRISAPFLAIIAGTIIEGLWCGLGAMFGKFGPCGAGNDLSGLLILVHMPGVWLAEMVVKEIPWLAWPLVIITSILQWSVVSFFAISMARLWRRDSRTHPGDAPD
jgi:hypothetical protein